MSYSLRAVVPSSPLAMLSSLPTCSSPDCRRPATLWQRWWARHEGIWLQERWYCSADCFELGLRRRIEQEVSGKPQIVRRRSQIPIGLVLLSQGEISAAQLRQALGLQKTTGRGKLGEWLVRMGAVSESQITGALAVQQRCPVFQALELQRVQEEMHWPDALVERYHAVPVFYRESQASLYVGFLGTVDHAFLYSVEQMLRCRTQPCIVPLSLYRRRRELREREREARTIEIQQLQKSTDLAQTIGSYAQQVQAETCALTLCGSRLWIRLSSARQRHVDFLFRLPMVN